MKILYILVAFFPFGVGKTFSQDTAARIFRIDTLPSQGILLNKGWRFHAGDNPEWAKPSLDDRKWDDIDPTLELNYLPQVRKEPVGWFRFKLYIDSSLLNKPLAFQVFQSIASEIYLNGNLIKRYGIVNKDKDKIEAIQPLNQLVGLQFKEPVQVLAVRFSVEDNLPYLNMAIPYSVFQFRINDIEAAGKFNRVGNKFSVLNAMYAGIFIVLTIIHLVLFVMYRKQKANLFFSIATASAAIANGLFIVIIYSHDISFRVYATIFDWIFLLTVFNLFLFIAIHFLFLQSRGIFFWIIVGYSLGSLLFWFSNVFPERSEMLAFMLPFWISMLESLRIAWLSYRKKHRDAGIIVVGLTVYLIFYSIFILLYEGIVRNREIGFGSDFSLIDITYLVGVISVPIALSLFLSRDFAFTSRELENQLKEVRHLSAKTIEQEQERQRILASQNETLEQQVKERTVALSRSLEELKSTQAQLFQSEKMASLGELTAGIAHEIQNPLNFVNNFSEVNIELLNELTQEMDKGNVTDAKGLAKDIQENEQKINHHGKRADRIVKGMLQHSRNRSGVKEPTDINALADEYLRLAYHGLRAKDKSFNASMKTDFDQTIGKVSIIPQDIGRVILNLITNAFYAVDEKRKEQIQNYEPSVSVSTKKLRHGFEVNVRDNGNGIPSHVIDKIFQPFFTTKPTGQGTGLGLSMSYDIIKGHKGELNVKTKEGEYTEFKIILTV